MSTLGYGGDEAVALLAEAPRVASGAGSVVAVGGRYRWLVFQLVVSGVGGAGTKSCTTSSTPVRDDRPPRRWSR